MLAVVLHKAELKRKWQNNQRIFAGFLSQIMNVKLRSSIISAKPGFAKILDKGNTPRRSGFRVSDVSAFISAFSSASRSSLSSISLAVLALVRPLELGVQFVNPNYFPCLVDMHLLKNYIEHGGYLSMPASCLTAHGNLKLHPFLRSSIKDRNRGIEDEDG